MAEGFRIAEAFVEITADDTGLRASILTKIEKAAAGTEIRSQIEPDGTGLNEKVKAHTIPAGERNPIKVPVKPKDDTLSTLSKELDQIGSKLGITWGRGLAAAFAGPILTSVKDLAASATAILGQVTAGIEDLSGAAGLMPAGIAVGVAAMATFKLGVQGVGAALKTANTPGQLKAQQQAMDQLTPSARDTAKALIGLKPIWADMQKNIQEHLFRGWATDLDTLGHRLIPVARTELGEMATSLNEVGHRLMQMAVSGPFVRDLTDTLSNGSTAVHNMAPGLEAVMQILRNIITEGSTFLPDLATGFSTAAKNAALFVQEARNTGKLHEWIQSGIDAVRNLWQGLKNVFATLHMLGQTAREVMPDMWGGFAGVTGKIREFVAEAQKSGKLKEWMQAGLDALHQVWQILKDLGAVFLNLASSPVGLLDILVAITGTLRWMSENVPFLIPMIGALFLAFKVGQTVVSMVQFVNLIREAEVVTKAWTAAQWLLNLAMDANPIGLIVLAIAGLVAVAVLVITHWTEVKNFFAPFFSWLGTMFSTVFGGIWDFLSGLWNNYLLPFFTQWGPVILAVLAPFIGIPLLIYQHWDQIRAWLGGIWDWVWGKATAVWNALVDFFKGAVDRIGGILSWFGSLPGKAAAWFGGLASAAMGKLNEFLSWIGGFPGWLWDKIKGAADRAREVGSAIVHGIWDGIQAGWNWLMDQVSNLAHSLLDAAKHALGIGSPSKAFGDELGRWLPPGIVQGALAAIPAAKAALSKMMQDLIPGTGSIPLELNGPQGGNWLQQVLDRFGTPEQQAAAKTEIGTVVLNIAGNLDPTNPTAWRKAIEDIRAGIRNVERSYA